ncbi:Hypothetical protein KFL_002730120 [Klebsormidium nitens]|uniref:Peptidase S9 prolyl oligopeptidase catalytic domain-containing protein n=1 Tax=Klebsormidium nitens TaxID=105231 RepID=A0A1Y1I5C5_KLENI|nr:Hypothetical protein KFL_002730120 [Klebsormidium nitens]|eukprot:GAQ86154.1 Hypothetical protein KFL_002730120 [Klebsormidium nitens]
MNIMGMIGGVLKYLGYGAGGLASVALVLLVALQDKLVYVPVIPGQPREYPYTPDRLGLEYEDVWLRAADGVKLHGWFIRATPRLRSEAAVTGPTVLFFQENAGNIAHRLENVVMMIRHLRCNMFLLSYRGYGASEGSPTERGLVMDAQAALDYLLNREDIDPDRIIAFGRSLGGAVATQLARKNPGELRAVILENTFTSILDMAGILMPALGYVIGGNGYKPLNFLVRNQWRTLEAIRELKEPILFLSGLKDEMIPPAMMKKLYRAATNAQDRVYVEFPTGMHMDTWLRGRESYWQALQDFLGVQGDTRTRTLESQNLRK